MVRPRDGQRQKVYDAERGWHDSQMELNPSDNLKTPGRTFSYAKMVWASPWTRKQFPVETRQALNLGMKRKTARCSSARRCHIRFGYDAWHMTKYVVLHEMAHAVCNYRESYQCAGHGREFVRRYLSLVQHFLGVESAKALRAAFREQNVKWYKSRGPMSPELREAAARRLAEAREQCHTSR